TLSLVETVQFDGAFTFIYSARDGTPAASMADDIPQHVKKERLHRLNEALNRLSKRSNERLIGQVVEVLVDGESKNNAQVLSGRTRTNKLVHFNGPRSLVGQLVQVKVTECQTFYVKGELVVAEAVSL